MSVCKESEANARLRVECAMIGLFFCMLRSIPIRAKRRGLQVDNSPMGRITVAGLLAFGIFGGGVVAFGRVATPSPHLARLGG